MTEEEWDQIVEIRKKDMETLERELLDLALCNDFHRGSSQDITLFREYVKAIKERVGMQYDSSKVEVQCRKIQGAASMIRKKIRTLTINAGDAFEMDSEALEVLNGVGAMETLYRAWKIK